VPEIAAKLHRADQMATDGMLQSDIARALGVSVMTYHRWRAGRTASAKASAASVAEVTQQIARTVDREQAGELDRLRIENGRLRKLLTDLLLEKARLEETLSPRVGSNDPRPTGARRDGS
jgi:transcriptional regulator with XRE-family HTH domain